MSDKTPSGTASKGTPELSPHDPRRPGRKPCSHIESPPEAEDLRYLRYAAGLHYTTDMRGTTLTQMAEHPVYGVVSLRALEEWSRKDRWIERRKATLEAWREQIARGIGSELTRVRSEQLARIQAIFEQAVAKLENDIVDAKSWEGVASVLVKLAELMDTWRDRIRSASVPEVSRGFDPPAQTRPQLTDEEARAAAMVIIHKRREQMRLEAAQQKALQEGEQKPSLQIVEGIGKA